MDTSPVPRPSKLRAIASLLALALVVSVSAAGCAGGEDHQSAAPVAEASHTAPAPSGPAAPAPAAEVPMGDMPMPTQDQVSAAWAARPDYVSSLPGDWQSAYAFALARPDVLQWLPCYCGCEGQGHRSNLDCFFQRRESGEIVFEEHGSYCDICVETANLAASMLREGSTMTEVRDAVDDTFSGRAPGTVTPLPPA
jgi:hypothetical protein